MSNYTPGTWTFHGSDDARIGDEIISSNGAPVLSGSIYNRADANLIAAAPEMLDVLHEALAMLNDPDADTADAWRVQSRIESVIAKATGQEV
jgi:hypothetical protein